MAHQSMSDTCTCRFLQANQTYLASPVLNSSALLLLPYLFSYNYSKNIQSQCCTHSRSSINQVQQPHPWNLSSPFLPLSCTTLWLPNCARTERTFSASLFYLTFLDSSFASFFFLFFLGISSVIWALVLVPFCKPTLSTHACLHKRGMQNGVEQG